MRLALGILLIGLVLTLPQAHAEVRGKVQVVVNPEAPRQEWRRAPLAGAYVTMFWSITVPAPAHATSTCPYTEIARTDENGQYVMEGPNFVTAALAHTGFGAYSPGLEAIGFPYEGTPQSAEDITMVRSTLAPESRLARISSYVQPRCYDTPLTDPHGVFGALQATALGEAKSLNVEPSRARVYIESIEHIAQPVRPTFIQGKPPMRAVVRPAPGSVESRSPVDAK